MSKAAVKVSDRIIQLAAGTEANDSEINILQGAVEEAVSLMKPMQRKMLLASVRNEWRQWACSNT